MMAGRTINMQANVKIYNIGLILLIIYSPRIHCIKYSPPTLSAYPTAIAAMPTTIATTPITETTSSNTSFHAYPVMSEYITGVMYLECSVTKISQIIITFS